MTGEKVRIDKWLWAARFFKTRSLATEAVAGGRVHVDGQRVKPAKEVRVGDRLEISVGEAVFAVEVLGLADKRGPASQAQGLYEESEESRARRERQRDLRRMAPPLGHDLQGRPSKRDRRRLEAQRAGSRRRGGGTTGV
ncbi:MAG: RNA-binding S4 domain-containing protein [Thermoleophilia bacterium]